MHHFTFSLSVIVAHLDLSKETNKSAHVCIQRYTPKTENSDAPFHIISLSSSHIWIYSWKQIWDTYRVSIQPFSRTPLHIAQLNWFIFLPIWIHSQKRNYSANVYSSDTLRQTAYMTEIHLDQCKHFVHVARKLGVPPAWILSQSQTLDPCHPQSTGWWWWSRISQFVASQARVAS